MTATQSEPSSLLSYKASPDRDRVVASCTAGTIDEAQRAIDAVEPAGWRLGLVFAATPEDLARSGELLRSRMPDLAVAGCTSAGIIDRHARVDAAIQITLLGGPGLETEVVAGSITGATSRQAGREAARALTARGDSADPTDHRVLILLSDGLVGEADDVVRGAYDAVGATVPIVGGCAGDDLAMVATHQLAGDQLLTGSVVGVGLRSSAPIGIGVRHGWSPIGSPMTVTAAEGTSVLGLDDRPALDAYLEAIGVDEAGLTSAGLAVACQTRPFGLESRGGYHVRFVRGGDLDRRAIEFLVAVPEGELVTLMRGDTDSVIGAAGDAVTNAVDELTGPPLGVVAFDCVACRGVLGDERLTTEVDRVASQLPADAIVSGLYTYGEIARRGGALGFHNQTMVVLAIQ
jgi:hypothetical protein